MVLEAKYPFIRDDLFLIARVYEEIDEDQDEYNDDEDYKYENFDEDEANNIAINRILMKTFRKRRNPDIYEGKQELLIQKINSETGEIEIEDKIICIHTDVMKMSVNKIVEQSNDVDSFIEEKFKALKSLVTGMAKAGIEIFQINGYIDQSLTITNQFTSFLLRFIAKLDIKYIALILARIEQQCVVNGQLHESSVIANLKILEPLINFDFRLSKDTSASFIESIISYILDFYPKFLFSHPNEWIRIYTAVNPEAPKFEEYELLFNDNNLNVRLAIKKNQNTKKAYPNHFEDLSHLNHLNIGGNPREVEKYKKHLKNTKNIDYI